MISTRSMDSTTHSSSSQASTNHGFTSDFGEGLRPELAEESYPKQSMSWSLNQFVLNQYGCSSFLDTKNSNPQNMKQEDWSTLTLASSAEYNMASNIENVWRWGHRDIVAMCPL